MSSRQPSPRYPQKSFGRMALAPGILAAVILLAGLALVGSEAFVWIQYPIAILAAIVGWFAIQGRAYWWLLGLVPILVLWNPVVPIELSDTVQYSLQIAAIGVFIPAGLMIKVPLAPEDASRR
ncbi:hypothetical protein HQQ80_07535 [Microbacteriaceae bacterium VKM Ac-2855]|nr:hypothetical protein [Microbacteriaceae bacterium VKM Ac-2855]